MHGKRALLLLFVLLIFTSPAGAALVTFTGNVDNDFNAVPGLISRPDVVTDPSSGLAGCQDQPLGPNAFVPPTPAPGTTPSSGFNLERTVTAYDCATDTLYIGLDVCESHIAWDADGNGNMTTKNPNILPGFVLRDVFIDDGLEDYQLEIDVTGQGGPVDLRIFVRSEDGGVTVVTTSPIKPAGVTVDAAVTGADVEVAVHGLRAAFPTTAPALCLPIVLTTRSGATGDLVDEDITIAPFDLCCTTCISITKGVSCSENGPFLPSAQALRGATVYFRIEVTNCGTDNLKDVVITDSFATNGACCPGGSCIPVSIPVGNLAPGETKTYTYAVPTDPAFAIEGVTADCTNTASVTGVGVLTGLNVNAGPVSATLDVLVPSITCSKLIDDDSNFAVDPGDLKPPTNDLNLAGGGQAWYQFCVENTGEVPVDFTAGQNPGCPSFNDSFLETPDAQIPGTGVDIDNLFRAQLQGLYGSNSLPAGAKVCVVVGPVTFNESILCPLRPEFPDTFQACGFATGPGICLPPGGGENVSTGECSAIVRLCPPCIRIEKGVSCSPDGPFLPSATALRGATVYFKVTVTNCGGEVLNNATVTDTMTEVDNALLNCTGCTGLLPGQCIPGVFNLGSLNPGQSKSFVCTVPTNPAFSITGDPIDGTNTASVTATSAVTQTVVTDGPESATVNLLVPSITCNKLIDDDNNPNPAQAGDPTAPTNNLNLTDAVMDTEQAWYWFCVENTGEIDVSFAAGASPSCPSFSDTFLETPDPQIPGTGQDLDAQFRTALQGLFGSHVLPAGQKVCIAVGPVSFDEKLLCGSRNVFPDTFSACGFATKTGICLPPAGGENVNTGNCNATLKICAPPCIDITKEVSCSPDGPFTESVTALRGATVYFKIVVTNCGGDNLSNVTITDTLTQEVDNALVSCSGCTNGLNCIPTSTGAPVQTNIGNLNVGESKTFICTVLTNAAFNVKGASPDATNSVSVVGTSVRTQQQVSDGPDTATVSLLVPGIACTKLADNDDNFADDPADLTPPTVNLDISQLPMGVKQAWYQICIENTGEVKVDFTAGAGPCPDFTDAFLETADPQIPGTGVDVDALFRSALIVTYGGQFLPAGQKVCVKVGPISLDQNILCPARNTIVNEFSACGIAKDTDICLPPGGGENVETGVCRATLRLCPVDICITKGVSCSPGGPFLPTATALRGATVYFQIVVENCGGEVLNNVTLTDVLDEEPGNPLLNCAGCTGIQGCIPSVINLGTLNPGEVKTIVCTFPTNPAFSVQGTNPDATNTASVTGIGAVSGTNVSDGPVEATVDVLVPVIACELLMDDDSDFSVDPSDLTPPDTNLNLANNGAAKVEQVWTKLTVCNEGEVDVDFCDQECAKFWAPLLTDMGIDVAQAFRDALQGAYGSCVLAPGACISVEFPNNPLLLDEAALCPNRTFFVNRFEACGFATDVDICLPPGGGICVCTGECRGTIVICQPVLFQAYPGDSNGTNVHYGGYLGSSGDTISAVPGVFVLVPGNNWENFVTAAEVGIPYTLKNVTLIKKTPEFIQCADVYPSITVAQQGTSNIRLRWPLMFEAPGTQWMLTIAYGTNTPWDDDGVAGPHLPGYFHEDNWTWKVEATLESMKLLLELFHEVPFATDEVPLISDETLYPILQGKLDNIIALYAANNIEAAARALGEFEMEVSDACIATSPREPNPTGPGTGIANSDENPACCKILVDAEYVGFTLGLFQAAK